MCNINWVCKSTHLRIDTSWTVQIRGSIDKASQVKEFREHFDNPSYMHGFPSTFFTAGPKHPSLFDRKCNNLLSTFGKKWHPPTMRTAVSVFSTQKWKEMDDHEKGKHTLSNCTVLPKVQITAGGNSQCNAASKAYTTREETIMRNDEEGSTQAEDTVRERLRFHSQE